MVKLVEAMQLRDCLKHGLGGTILIWKSGNWERVYGNLEFHPDDRPIIEIECRIPQTQASVNFLMREIINVN